jgi:hypothetical protein
VSFKDKNPTQFDLDKEAIANYVKEKKPLWTGSLWARYTYRSKHRTMNFIERIYANWLLTWTQTA